MYIIYILYIILYILYIFFIYSTSIILYLYIYMYYIYICGYFWWSSGDIIMNQWDWTNWRTPRDARLGKKLVRKLAKRSWSIWLGQGDPAVASWWNTGFSCVFVDEMAQIHRSVFQLFATCRVKVSRFYQSYFLVLRPSSSFLILPTANSRSQTARPDLNRDAYWYLVLAVEVWLRSGSAHVRKNVRIDAR